MAYTRGVLSTGAGTYGYVQSISFAAEGEEVLIKDEAGVTQVEDLYDEVNNVTVSAKFDRAVTLPARGDTITLAACPSTSFNGKYTITSVGADESNTDAANISLTLRRFVDGDVPAS